VPELIAKSALEGRSLTLDGLTLAEVEAGPITSIAVYPGQGKAVAKGLKPLGLAMPEPNTFAEKKGARIVWTGRDQAFLVGIAAPDLDGGALTDQSDAWATLALAGAGGDEVLARLVPMDLRAATFPVGRVARTQVNHMNAVILRSGADVVEIMVFRSMARTAWHELEAAMQMVTARYAAKI
jgi:sarcosine oxidase subunit gamma